MGFSQRATNGLTQSNVNTGLTKGTTSTLTTTAASAGTIASEFVTPVAALTNSASPTVDCVTGKAFLPINPNECTVLVIGQTAAGVVQMCQGGIEKTAPGVTTTAGPFLTAPQFPTPPDNFMPWGYLLVRAAPSASPWIPGTGSWTATGITAGTVYNIATLPDRPQAK